MNNSPKGILSLIQKFPTEEKCIDYLESLRWNGHIDCPHCGSDEKIYKFKDNKTYKCAACKRNFTVLKNTIFERTHISLTKWFIAIYLFASHKKGISSHQLARDLDITQPNAWFLLHRIRFAMNNNPDFKKVMNGIIEVDETYVGGKNKNRHWDKKVPNSQGRSLVDKSVIFGILSRENGVITFHPKRLPKRGLQAIIKAKVNYDSIVNTDEYRAYSGLNKFYVHQVVNHGKYQYANGNFHTNSIEGFWSWLKRSILGIYHSVGKKYLMRYCREMCFRYNLRKKENEGIFETNLFQCFNCRLTYKDLIS